VKFGRSSCRYLGAQIRMMHALATGLCNLA
jgi:hypothetical protein